LKHLLLCALLIVFACARTTATRDGWLKMSHDEKTLYVRSLIGHEKAKEAKGGNQRVYERPAEIYVQEIDAAYARGEQRTVDEVFETLGAMKNPSPTGRGWPKAG
jgi:predicted Fe-S protein YdhL (DUF1289 family)